MSVKKNPKDSNQYGLFQPVSNWKPPSMSDLPEFWRASETALDTEGRDPNLLTKGPGWYQNDGETVGISLCVDGHTGIYLPFAHEGGDNLPRDKVLEYVRYGLKQMPPEATLILMNGMYDLGWLSVYDIAPSQCKIWDIMWVEALLNEHRDSYSLTNLCKYHGIEGKDEQLLKDAANAFGVDPKGGLWRLPARYVAPYAEQDAVATFKVFNKQRPMVLEQGLTAVVELEHSLIPWLLQMRRKGIRIDMDQAAKVRDGLKIHEDGCVSRIKDLTGCSVDIYAADSIAKALDTQNISYNRTATGKPSFTKDFLEKHPSEICRLVTEARQYNKVGKDFVGGNMERANNGRLHTELHPLRSDAGGTVTGRMSSSSPNLQQLPARHPILGPMCRSLFLPEEGEQWCSIDYSQQEPRLTIHYAAKGKFTGGEEAAATYRENPDTDYHTFVAALTGLERKPAKTINLGMTYGMGGAKLCRSLGLPTEWRERNGFRWEDAGPEGTSIINQYHEKMPFIKELIEQFKGDADRDGFVKTLSHRRCRFPLWEPIKKTGTGRMLPFDRAVEEYGRNNIRRAELHKALNKKIQGGAADMVKVSIRDLWREGIPPLLTIHDENAFSIADKKTANRAAEIMRNCVKLEVPMKVDIDWGRSWGEAKSMVEDEAA